MPTEKLLQEKPVHKNKPKPGPKFLSLIQDYCLQLKYNGRMIIKHLFDSSSYSTFRVNWYAEVPDKNVPVIPSEKIIASHFIIIDLATMEIKIKE